jgi:hypothetical protein
VLKLSFVIIYVNPFFNNATYCLLDMLNVGMSIVVGYIPGIIQLTCFKVLVIAVGLDARRRVQDQRLGDAGDKNDYF